MAIDDWKEVPIADWKEQPIDDWKEVPISSGVELGNKIAATPEYKKARDKWVEDSQNPASFKEAFIQELTSGPSVKDRIAELPRVLTEGAAMGLSGLGYGLGSVASVVKGGGEAIRTGNIDKGLQSYKENMSKFKPLDLSPYIGESQLAKSIAPIYEPANKAVGEAAGDPELLQKLMYLLPLKGAKGAAGKTSWVDRKLGAGMETAVEEAGTIAGNVKAGKGVAESFTPSYEKARAYAERNVPIILKGKTTTAKTNTQLKEMAPTTVNGWEHIVDEARAGKLSLEGESRVPKNLMEAVEAQDQTLGNIAKRMHEETSAATGQGILVDTTPLIAELKAFAELPEVLVGNKSAVTAALKQAENLMTAGRMTPDTIAKTLTGINAQLKQFYKNGQVSDLGNVTVLDNTARYLRSKLNEAVEAAGVAEHAGLRKTYGDVVSSRESMVKAAQANQAMPAHMGFGEVLSAAEMAHGLVNMNPATMGSGAILLALKKAYKYYGSPNRRIEAAFKKLENTKPVTPERPPIPEVPPPNPETMPPVPRNDASLGDVVQGGGGRNLEQGAMPPQIESPDPANLGVSGDITPGKVVNTVKPVAPPPAKPLFSDNTGGGAAPASQINLGLVKEVAAKIGLPVAVIMTFLQANDLKKKQLIQKYPQLGDL